MNYINIRLELRSRRHHQFSLQNSIQKIESILMLNILNTRIAGTDSKFSPFYPWTITNQD